MKCCATNEISDSLSNKWFHFSHSEKTQPGDKGWKWALHLLLSLITQTKFSLLYPHLSVYLLRRSTDKGASIRRPKNYSSIWSWVLPPDHWILSDIEHSGKAVDHFTDLNDWSTEDTEEVVWKSGDSLGYCVSKPKDYSQL